MGKVLECLHACQHVQQTARVERVVGRAEAPAFGRLAQPVAFFGQANVVVVVANGGGVDAA